MLQWRVQRDMQFREEERIPESTPQFRLKAATRLHEDGIASNGGSYAAVNTFPGLVHTARQAMEAGGTRRRLPNPQGRASTKVKLVTGAKS